MATLTEVQSLGEIQYKGKIKLIFLFLLVPFLFTIAFLNYFPVGDKLKTVIKTTLNGRGCNPDFDQIHMEWLLPKIVVTNLTIPQVCLERSGAPMTFSHLTINFNLISFSPFGLPFRIDTNFAGQPLSLYFVQGFGKQLVRIKDQTLDLARMEPILGENVELAGKVVIDLNLALAKNAIDNFVLKAQSKNLQIPPQNVQGFTTPPLKLNQFYLEATSEIQPRIKIDKLILGDTDSPMRANFKGKIDLQQGNAQMSPLDLVGEVAFSETFRQSLPLVDMMFQSFTQKDGFYQIRLGGTLGAPKPLGP